VYRRAVAADDDRAVPSVDDDVDLRHYLGILRRRWKTVAFVVLVVVATAFGVSARQEPRYRARSEILVQQRSTDSLFTDSNSAGNAQDAERAFNNEVRLLESDAIRALVDDAYDGPIPVSKVNAAVSSESTDVIAVSVAWKDPEEAAELVNTYVSVFIDARRQQKVDELLAAGAEIQTQIDDLTVQIAAAQAPLDQAEAALAADPTNEVLASQRDDVADRVAQTAGPLESRRSFYQQQLEDLRLTAGMASSGGAEVLTEAKPVDTPVSPKPLRDAGIGLVIGLLLGIAIAYLRDRLDERIRDSADVDRVSGGLPILASIPTVEGKVEPRFVACRDDPRSHAAEAYRSLRTSVKFSSLDHPIKVLQVTSASSGEGKSTTVSNLGVVLAQGGDRVAIVCCDLRRPTVHERFEQTLAPGFTDVLVGDETLSRALRGITPNLFVLPAGSLPPNPSELLSTQRASAIISALAEEFDVVLLDSTPILPVTDALVMSRLVDATLVVIDSRMTKRNALRRTLQMLRQVNAPVLGLVLNGVQAGSDGYGYRYGYGSDESRRGRLRWKRRDDDQDLGEDRLPVPVGRP
jgi:polysaccharide biosynthesis transport protein